MATPSPKTNKFNDKDCIKCYGLSVLSTDLKLQGKVPYCIGYSYNFFNSSSVLSCVFELNSFLYVKGCGL
jgi:hypothetical protein